MTVALRVVTVNGKNRGTVAVLRDTKDGREVWRTPVPVDRRMGALAVAQARRQAEQNGWRVER